MSNFGATLIPGNSIGVLRYNTTKTVDNVNITFKSLPVTSLGQPTMFINLVSKDSTDQSFWTFNTAQRNYLSYKYNPSDSNGFTFEICRATITLTDANTNERILAVANSSFNIINNVDF